MRFCGLPTAVCGGMAYTAQETYDHFGNRNVETVTVGTNQWQPSNYLHFSAGNNRADEGSYDNAGNPFSDGTNNYLYDAENRFCAVQQIAAGGGGSVIGYLYAPDGIRLGKNANLTSFSCDMTKNGMLTSNGLVLTSLYTVGPQGEQLEETDGSLNLIHFNVFWEGKVLGSYSGTTGAETNWHFALNDWVGTKRVTTNSDGAYSASFFNGPFGDFQTPGGTGSDPSEHHFTGKERDIESGLDYFPARYYNSNVGRWMSPDPSMEGAILELPQTWNKYSYEYNRPTYGTDPDGSCPPCIGAIIGGVLEGGFDAGKQFINNGYSFSGPGFSGKEVLANIAGGAVAGAIAGATGGASLVADAFIGDVAAGATSNIIGNVVTRALDPNTSSDDVLSVGNVSEDALAGFVGGAGGHIAADFVHIPGEPRTVKTRSGSVYRRQMANRQAAVASRNRAVINQAVRSGVTSSIGTHSTNGIFDWLFTKQPCFFTSASDNHGNSTGSSGCQ